MDQSSNDRLDREQQGRRSPEGGASDPLIERARLRREGRDRVAPEEPRPEALLELAEGLRPFARYLSGRDARPRSMSGYVRNANQARRLLIEAGFEECFADVPLEEFPWHCLTPEVAARLSELLRGRYPNPKSREKLIGAVRRLVGHCVAAGLISTARRDRVLAELPVPAAYVRGEGRELALEEIRRLLHARSSADERLHARDTAVLVVFLSTGLRISEVCEIGLEDIEDSEGGGLDVAVRSKGGRRRHLWLTPGAAQIVRGWLEIRGSHPGALFDSKARPGVCLSTDGVRDMIARRARAAGLSTRFSSHDLRRTFATRALRDGVDPFTVQRLLGHVNVQTTLIYDRRSEADDRDALERLDLTHLVRDEPKPEEER